MSADAARRQHYEQDMAPMGASYGDEMTLPVLPDNAVPPAGSALYPWQGDEPVNPAG